MIFLTLTFFACRTQIHDGTSVGNPTELTLLVAPNAGLTINEGLISLSSLSLNYATGTWTSDPIPSFHPADRTRILVPTGTWQESELLFASPLHLQGTLLNEQEQGFDITLALSSIALLAPDTHTFEEGTQYILELGTPNWLSDSLTSAESGAIQIDAFGSQHDGLALAFGLGAQLFVDQDGDGWLSEDERNMPNPNIESSLPNGSEIAFCLAEHSDAYTECLEESPLSNDDCLASAEEEYLECLEASDHTEEDDTEHE